MPFLLLVALFTSVCGAISAQTEIEPQAIIGEYVAASQAQQNRLQGASMEVEINAELPKLHRSGRLLALRRISDLGRITYEALRFEGDKRIKSDVIARYLTAEAEAQKGEQASLAVTPANYKFKFQGLIERDGRKVYVFRVSPRKKKVGLYQGDLWLDAENYLPVRESGRLVKSPSVFVSKIEFVRDYQTVEGVALPKRLLTSVKTRLVGKATLSIDFRAVSLSAGSQIARVGGGL